MEIEPFDTVGVRGRDFVVYGEEQRPRFEARQLAGSKVLKIGWTENIPWTLFWLRVVQRLAGGPGSIERIEGLATDRLAAAINDGAVDDYFWHRRSAAIGPLTSGSASGTPSEKRAKYVFSKPRTPRATGRLNWVSVWRVTARPDRKGEAVRLSGE